MVFQILLVGVGGFLGSVSRFGMTLALRNSFSHVFPWATLAINVLGCMAIGFLYEQFREHPSFPSLSLFVAVGFLGSFTTFSAFGLETLQLFREGFIGLAFCNAIASVVLCLGGVVLGTWFGKLG